MGSSPHHPVNLVFYCCERAWSSKLNGLICDDFTLWEELGINTKLKKSYGRGNFPDEVPGKEWNCCGLSKQGSLEDRRCFVRYDTVFFIDGSEVSWCGSILEYAQWSWVLRYTGIRQYIPNRATGDIGGLLMAGIGSEPQA